MIEGMSRRRFLRLLSRAAAAAMTIRGARPLLAMPTIAPDAARGLLSQKQSATLSKTIDAFVPPGTELRQRLSADDPGYDFVTVFEAFCFQSGEQFADNAKVLLDLVNVLPTLMPLFFSRWGLPTFQLTWLSDED